MLIVYNPATGEEIGRVAKNTSAEVKAAVDRTCAAVPAWSRLNGMASAWHSN